MSIEFTSKLWRRGSMGSKMAMLLEADTNFSLWWLHKIVEEVELTGKWGSIIWFLIIFLIQFLILLFRLENHEVFNGILKLYADGFKLQGNVQCDISLRTFTRVSYGLLDHCSVFEVKVMTVPKAGKISWFTMIISLRSDTWWTFYQRPSLYWNVGNFLMKTRVTVLRILEYRNIIGN